jgi:DNA-binding beta-propeller fold protein YncE
MAVLRPGRRHRGRNSVLTAPTIGLLFLALVACAQTTTASDTSSTTTIALSLPSAPASSGTGTPTGSQPAAVSTEGVYAHTGVGQLSPAVAEAKAYIYVPSNDDGSVTVIDQATMEVVTHYKVGKLVQHVVASYDLSTLYATASGSNRLVAIDPKTGEKGKSIPVDAPYNLYFSPDGKTAIVMAERLRRMDFYDSTTWKKQFSVTTPCKGINHADWSVDETWFLATCEFSGDILKVDTATGKVLNVLPLDKGAMPQDLRLAPTGDKFYVADMEHGCVWIIDKDGTAVTGKIDTGVGPHGIYPSRDASVVYVTNRGRKAKDTSRKSRPGEGSVSVVDPKTDTVIATWEIPQGGSPDMGGVSADGKTLWLSGRYDDVVYAFDTATGALITTIPVPGGPHGLAVFPQPGRYSLGHTGNYR